MVFEIQTFNLAQIKHLHTTYGAMRSF